ncbi:MAG: acetyl-CoA decarbonylase/synthase complex subunit delta [Candidatus Omnitrophota bacterium]|jgi:acetyl-CoA decarbonylase/synthase complex subunit delta
MSKVSTITIGAVKSEGGSRSNSIKIGGEESLPCLFKEGAISNKPQIAFEVWDIAPTDWHSGLTGEYGEDLDDPILWAEKCAREFKANSICVRLQGAHPDSLNKSPNEEADFIKRLTDRVKLPLIIIGCGDDLKDSLLLPACSEAVKGEKCLIGSATQDNYKAIAVSALANGHSIIAESPIDVNIAKQLNILISDTGMPLEEIAINPTIGALGYGLEYAYSIMERARLAALSGDKTLASPFVCLVGQEAWRAKEAKTEDVNQGIIWEVLTATALIQAGADLLIMRHPKAIEKVNKYIDNLFIGE